VAQGYPVGVDGEHVVGPHPPQRPVECLMAQAQLGRPCLARSGQGYGTVGTFRLDVVNNSLAMLLKRRDTLTDTA